LFSNEDPGCSRYYFKMPIQLIPEACRFELSVLLADSGIVVRPALRLLTLATMEEKVGGIAVDAAGRPRTSCTPFVLVENGGGLFPDLGTASYVLGGRRFYFPLTLEFDSRLSFDIAEGQGAPILKLFTTEGRLEFPVSERFATFVRLTETLGLMVPAADDDTFTVVSVRQRGSDLARPHVADAGALMSDAKFEKTLETKKAWRAKSVANPELYVGHVNNSVTYEHYVISEFDRRVSKTLVQEICLLCRTTKNITREHCTPHWLMKRMKLQPIVALIFCSSCNSEQGRKLESPIEQAFISGNFPSDENLTKMWALKTSLTLAVSQNIRVPRVLAEAVRTGDFSLGGAEVLALQDQSESPKREFRFVAASLPTDDCEKGRCTLIYLFELQLPRPPLGPREHFSGSPRARYVFHSESGYGALGYDACTTRAIEQ
jgi:hypothetical protein